MNIYKPNFSNQMSLWLHQLENNEAVISFVRGENILISLELFNKYNVILINSRINGKYFFIRKNGYAYEKY